MTRTADWLLNTALDYQPHLIAAAGLAWCTRWTIRRLHAASAKAHQLLTAPTPERDAPTELDDLEHHFDAYAARNDQLYPREENPQP